MILPPVQYMRNNVIYNEAEGKSGVGGGWGGEGGGGWGGGGDILQNEPEMICSFKPFEEAHDVGM